MLSVIRDALRIHYIVSTDPQFTHYGLLPLSVNLTAHTSLPLLSLEEYSNSYRVSNFSDLSPSLEVVMYLPGATLIPTCIISASIRCSLVTITGKAHHTGSVATTGGDRYSYPIGLLGICQLLRLLLPLLPSFSSSGENSEVDWALIRTSSTFCTSLLACMSFPYIIRRSSSAEALLGHLQLRCKAPAVNIFEFTGNHMDTAKSSLLSLSTGSSLMFFYLKSEVLTRY